MTGRVQILAALEAALACGETSVIVRSSGAIAEVHGLVTLRQGAEWVTLGEEGQTHVHLKIEERSTLRYRRHDEANAVLELAGPDGSLLCRVTFRGTNRAKTEQYCPERAAKVHEQFGCWVECAGI
ncbi:hypothetical protein [Nitrospira defluvii]|uniref:Uncharacterized protein n=1 Tax=Nitrospira defluvii TaxID=330214 RepID=A0ABN7M069_9BACT|nr:hypothetical protein [Nitrospira defluvii]CAE6778202.1 conserved hypothetical protein [Nitrospira defluvii]